VTRPAPRVLPLVSTLSGVVLGRTLHATHSRKDDVVPLSLSWQRTTFRRRPARGTPSGRGVLDVSDMEGTFRADDHSARLPESGLGRRAAIAQKAGLAGPSDGRDPPVRVEFLDAVVPGKVEVSVGVKGFAGQSAPGHTRDACRS
jgi:hypothetical protein